jgi:GWxTD domain-containing protein
LPGRFGGRDGRSTKATCDVTLLNSIIASAVLAATGAPQAGPPIEVTVKRFLRGEQTLVDGFCRVGFDFLTPIAAGPGAAEAVYRVKIAVRDSAGGLMHESDWSQSVAQSFLGIPGASTVEHFAFVVPDGHYSVAVDVTDSASGKMHRASVDVPALEDVSRLSDLYLTGEARRATAEGAALGPGEIQKGSFLLSANTTPVLTPRQPELFYYLELYPGQDASVELHVRVLSGDGTAITKVAPQQLEVGAAGGVAARSLSLAGLPEGAYALEVVARFPDREVVRKASFSMAGFETEAEIARAATPESAIDPFALLTESQLDSLYGPLVYIQEADERRVYENLSIQGKRSYLRTFWEKRDPTPGTPVNETREMYYRLFAEASRRYREGGAAGVPGWRTDRGRIFLKYGEAGETLRRPQAGSTRPYEVWKYTRPRLLKFVFMDETGLGNYALIYTDDRFEQGRPDWEALLGREAVEDVLRF